MADQTLSNLSQVVYDIWTEKTLSKQFYNKYPWLQRLKKESKYTDELGNEARVPLQTGLSGADTTLSSAGGTLNPADPNRVARAVYGLSYNWRTISMQFGALNQSSGGASSAVEAKNFEIENALDAMSKSVQRQFLGDGTALLAQCTTTTTAATVNLLTTGYGPDHLVRGNIRVGQTIDIGTTADEVAVAADRQITAVSIPNSTITISGATVSTTSSHYVSIANARVGTTSNESIGLRAIAGGASTVVGGIDPATSTYWTPASVDTTTTVISPDVPLALQQAVFQNSGEFPTFAMTSIKQLTNLYRNLQNQSRFSGDVIQAGNVQKLEWNGMNIEAYPDVPDREWYQLHQDPFLIVTGHFKEPKWASQMQGSSTGMLHTVGTTAFGDDLVYALGLGTKSRRTQAAAIGLTA